jgi:hypothetical protein
MFTVVVPATNAKRHHKQELLVCHVELPDDHVVGEFLRRCTALFLVPGAHDSRDALFGKLTHDL